MKQLFRTSSLALVVALSCFASQAEAQHTSAVTEITCELERASEALKDELKYSMRRVKGYGVMLGYTAQIRSRAASIERRFLRDPNYRGLDRDVARIRKVSGQLDQRLRSILNCPHTLSRADGHVDGVIARVRQICSLSRSLEIAARPFCIAPQPVVPAFDGFSANAPRSGHLHAARPGSFDSDRFRFERPSWPSIREQLEDRFRRQQFSADPFAGNQTQLIPSQPLPRGFDNPGFNDDPFAQTLPETSPRGIVPTQPRTFRQGEILTPQLHGPQPLSGNSILDRR